MIDDALQQICGVAFVPRDRRPQFAHVANDLLLLLFRQCVHILSCHQLPQRLLLLPGDHLPWLRNSMRHFAAILRQQKDCTGIFHIALNLLTWLLMQANKCMPQARQPIAGQGKVVMLQETEKAKDIHGPAKHCLTLGSASMGPSMQLRPGACLK